MNDLMNKIRKFNLLHFAIFIVTITLAIIAIFNSYSKYISSISSNASIGIARWKIEVNNQDISQGSSLTNVITPVFNGDSNIASNVIAPTAEGYFDLDIDASNTDVSFRYEITTSPNAESSVSDLIISGYEIDGGQRQAVSSTSGFRIENTVAYDAQDKTFSMRVYLKWNDDSDNGAVMDNNADTTVTTTTSSVAKLNVNLRFIQLPTSSTTTTSTTTTETTTT
ncbi:MAG: hypothetical protein VZS44_03085 [Bacilli bacterium]|nr:hypothetical protein [Bacilli bacterium]